MTTLRESGIEMIEIGEVEPERWREQVTPLRERYIAQHEAEGLPARAVVADLGALGTEYASLSDEQIMARVTNSPTQGIIDL